MVRKTSYSWFLLWRIRRAIERQQKLVDLFFNRANLGNPSNRQVMIRELIEIDRRLTAMRTKVNMLTEKTRRFATLERQIFRKTILIIFSG